jgi:TP901 family phage tail tape measure protein
MPDYDLGTARGKIELDASSLGRASAAFTGLGKTMIGVGAVAVGAFAYAVKSAADFEKIMSAVGAVTNATAAEMDLLKDKALDLAAGSIFSADQIGSAFEDLGKAGITVDEILGGAAEAVVHLAHAAGDELPGGVAQGAEIIANAMKTFEVGADQAEHFADVLVAAAASSTVSVDDMATTFRYAGPIAHELGLSIDDLSAVIAILGDRGIKGSTAGTSLRGVLLSLTPTSAKAASQMKELGLITEDGTNRFYDMNGALKPIPEVMQILKDATKDLTQEQKVQAFNTIFQRRAMNAALIMADQGAAGFDRYAAAIARLDASTIAAKKLDNLHGDMTILKNTVDALIIRVGMPLQDMIRGWVQSLTDLVNKLGEVNPELLAQIVMYGAIAGSVLIAAGSFLYMVGIIIKLYRTWIILKEAMALAWAAFKLLSISFLTNPIVLIVAAIVALAAVLYLAYQRSEEFRSRVDKLFDAFEPAFNAIKGFVTNFVEQFQNLIDVIREGDDVAQGVAEVIDNMFGNTGNLIGPIKALVEGIQQLDDVARKAFGYFADTILPVLFDFAVVVGKSIAEAVRWFIDVGIPAIQDFVDVVVEQFGLAVDWFGRNVAPIFIETGNAIAAVIDRLTRVIGFFSPFFKMIWDHVTNHLRAAFSIIESIVESIMLVWGNFSDNIFRIITGAWQRVRQTIESFLRIIRGIITTFTGIISGDWSKAWGGIQQIFSGVWAAIGDIVQNAWFLIWNLLSAGIDLLISMWEVGWNTIADVVSTVWDFMWSMISGILTTIWELIKRHLDLVKSTFQNIWNAIYSWFAPKIRLFATVVSEVISRVVTFFRELWGKVTGAVGDLAGKVYTFFRTAFTRMFNAVTEKAQEVFTYMGKLPARILSYLGDLGSILYNAGKAILQGLWDGMKDKWEDAKDWVGSLPGKIIDLKGPPEKDAVLLTNNGELIMQSLQKGLMKGWPAIAKLMSGMAPAMVANVTASGVLATSADTSGNSGGTNINLTFEFPNVTNGDDAEAIETAVTDSSVLGKLVGAIKAGRK